MVALERWLWRVLAVQHQRPAIVADFPRSDNLPYNPQGYISRSNSRIGNRSVMHITQHTDYALRTLIYLGSNTERLVTILEVSDRFSVSRAHLMKVVNQLIRAGFVEGMRGKGGGLRLARPASEIVVGEVVRRMERRMEIVECFGEGCKCILDPDCKLKNALSAALEAFLNVLDGLTLADLLGERATQVLKFFKPQPA